MTGIASFLVADVRAPAMDDLVAFAFGSPQIDLAAMMRARCGLDAPEPVTASTHPHTIAELLTGAAMAREPRRHRSAAAPALPS